MLVVLCVPISSFAMLFMYCCHFLYSLCLEVRFREDPLRYIERRIQSISNGDARLKSIPSLYIRVKSPSSFKSESESGLETYTLHFAAVVRSVYNEVCMGGESIPGVIEKMKFITEFIWFI